MLETIIGLEIHAQLATKSKLFCSCANNPEEQPNFNICPICTGQPGVLPVVNKTAVEWTILMGLALNCQISEDSKFDRKNYFYPDLPKGYQISQYDKPLCKNGYLGINIEGKTKKIRLERIHLEEDTGKLIHPEGKNYSLVDFNRAGTPLIEIVTKPDLRSPEEAKIFLQELQRILRYLKISEADMEKGQLRCDANISLRKKGEAKLSAKTEIKNMNSFRAVERALKFEEKRQKELWEKNIPPKTQSTRGWDGEKEITFEMRTKEEVEDYRYFPEPDLPPLHFSKVYIDQLKDKLGELPRMKQARFVKEYGLKEAQAKLITINEPTADYFEKLVSEAREWSKSLEGKEKVTEEEFKNIVQLIAGWYTSKFFGLLNKTETKIEDCKITPENFAELMLMLYEKKINSKVGQEVLGEMFKTGGDPSQIVETKGLCQVTDEDQIAKIVDQAISENPQPVSDFKKGKENALQFLVGKVMQKTKGKANPEIVARILKEKLKG